ncbi:fructosamine kinase family protein [Puniceicoccales bacterium CK1056]|uniref:Fructosamine kinase family protein n=1 Tax=Oceanipulchritudo coccoides TaxID=2706888 RepID=A0A6B2LWK2_9BACT|nr:fructosamine kinase family protein [Oceanipulchritudo coccoides]NDV60838.1 fructosamine kinase family protein [Oceanipulchritudo coccoides]
MNKEIEAAILKATGSDFRIKGTSSLGGGCIHNAQCLTGTDGRRFFIKQNRPSFRSSFEAEAAALRAIGKTKTIRVPEPVAVCSSNDMTALVLEFLPIGRAHPGSWENMGKELARLHHVQQANFGWEEDNWIGSTRQINTWKNDWIGFYAECRLQPQVQWAREKGLRLSDADVLIGQLHLFFDTYSPTASLLHGDPWAGNAGFLEDGTPVVFDPASYFGDRETDLAMTELFGGFPKPFYDGYGSVWPIDPGYERRRDLYQLYHVLNHFNIFGGGYGDQAASMIRHLLRGIG